MKKPVERVGPTDAGTVTAVVTQPSAVAPPPINKKLNELEDFLKELKTKKKEQLVSEGKGKKI